MSRFSLDVIGKSFEVELKRGENKGFIVSINGKEYNANIEEISETGIWVSVAGNLYSVKLQNEPASSKLETLVNYRKRIVESPDIFGSKKVNLYKKSNINDPHENSSEHMHSSLSQTGGLKEGILAPMPGKVVMVNKKVGDDVKPGDVLVILEAMKMENEITSDKEGKITEVRVKEGDSVDAHDVLVVVG
jgi:biotin carboxyl carrier protein